jgi:hypothetical protein
MTYKNYLDYATSVKEGYENLTIMGSQPHIDALFSDTNNLTFLTEDEYYEKLTFDDEFFKNMESCLKEVSIDKKELYKLYMEWVNQVTEECDWKTHFEPEEIVYSIANILENNPDLIIKNC